MRAEVLDAAGAWLAERWDPDRVKGGDARAWRQIAGYSAFFANVPHELADAALQWCGRELGMGLAARRFDAVSTARVLLWCDAHGLPGLLLRAPELAERVSAAQAPDGAWAPGPQSSPEGPQPSPEARAAHTLDALLALRHLGGRGGGLP